MIHSLILAAAAGVGFGLDGITWWCILAFVALVVVLGLTHHRRPRPVVTEHVEHHHVRMLAGPILFDQDAA